MSQDGDHQSSLLILKLILSLRPQWIVVEITTNVLVAVAPTMMTVRPHPTEQGRMPLPAKSRHWSNESLLYAMAHLGLLLCRDTDLYLLIGLGLLFRMW
jgi:hypothetical protein